MLSLRAYIKFAKAKDLTNRIEYNKWTTNWWMVWVTIRFNKQRDEPVTIFTVTPPISTPSKLRKELSFKTNSYKELCKWLKKNEKKVGRISDNSI